MSFRHGAPSRALLGTGTAIFAGSMLAGLMSMRRAECADGQKNDRSAPLVTELLLGSIGLTLAVRGGVRFAQVPQPRRSLAREAAAGRKAGVVIASLGLGLLSAGIVSAIAVMESSTYWSS